MSNTRITHYIPPAKLPEVVHEFVEPNPSDHFIHWLFRHRCIVCKSGSNIEINEILPRARSKKAIWDWRNRVTMCRGCHTIYHLYGVTKAKMDVLSATRKEFLISIGRGEYV